MTDIILHLTQHPATPDQRGAGVVDLVGDALDSLKRLLTFTTCPTAADLIERAEQLC